MKPVDGITISRSICRAWRRRCRCALLAAIFLLPLPAQAFSPEQRAEIETFVAGNVMFTLFHEAGHALIDILDLPNLGREENAVDNLATLLMIGDPGAAEADSLLFAAADGWAILHEQSRASGAAMPFWDSHSLDIQRYVNILCLIYGSDPDGFEEAVGTDELPEARRDACPEEYEKAASSWAQVLAPHQKRFGAGAKGRVKVIYAVPATSAGVKARKVLKDMRAGDLVAKAISANAALDRDLTLRFAACGEANAHYDPDAREIIMCYELVASFTEMIEADLRRP